MEVRLLLISSSPLISYLPALLLPPALSVFHLWFLSPAPPCSPALLSSLLSCPALLLLLTLFLQVLEGQNILVTISGKKNRVRVYYLSWLKSKILK